MRRSPPARRSGAGCRPGWVRRCTQRGSRPARPVSSSAAGLSDSEPSSAAGWRARLDEARRHGATDIRLAADDLVDWIRGETDGFGADFTFEATGNVRVMKQAVEAAREAWGLATM